MSGKGDKRRPTMVSESVSKANWDRIFGKKEPEYETYYLCAACMEEVHTLPPDGIDYCQSCDRIVEGNTLKCKRELAE